MLRRVDPDDPGKRSKFPPPSARGGGTRRRLGRTRTKARTRFPGAARRGRPGGPAWRPNALGFHRSKPHYLVEPRLAIGPTAESWEKCAPLRQAKSGIDLGHRQATPMDPASAEMLSARPRAPACAPSRAAALLCPPTLASVPQRRLHAGSCRAPLRRQHLCEVSRSLWAPRISCVPAASAVGNQISKMSPWLWRPPAVSIAPKSEPRFQVATTIPLPQRTRRGTRIRHASSSRPRPPPWKSALRSASHLDRNRPAPLLGAPERGTSPRGTAHPLLKATVHLDVLRLTLPSLREPPLQRPTTRRTQSGLETGTAFLQASASEAVALATRPHAAQFDLDVKWPSVQCARAARVRTQPSSPAPLLEAHCLPGCSSARFFFAVREPRSKTASRDLPSTRRRDAS